MTTRRETGHARSVATTLVKQQADLVVLDPRVDPEALIAAVERALARRRAERLHTSHND